jgi:hypothetical protein
MPTVPQLANIPQLAQQYAAEQAALGPAPPDLPPISEDPQAPSIQSAPQRVLPPSPQDKLIANDQARLEKIHWQQQNPWGTANNHPGVGGKIAHVLSVAGNIAGDIFAPDVMARVPGTQMNREEQEQGLTKRLNAEVGDEAKNEQDQALTAQTKQNMELAPAKAASEEALQHVQTEEGQQALDMGPTLIMGHAHAVNKAIEEHRDPGTDPVVLGYERAIQAQQKPLTPKGAHFIQREVGGKPHTIAVDDLSGADIRDEGETGEKPPVVNVNAGNSALDRETTRFAKPYEKGVADANTQLDKIADARSMINGSAEAQALGVPKVLTALVSGAGSGVRITQPELNAIAGARGLSGDIQGTLNAWAGQGKLTAIQKQQLTGILDDVKTRILAKQQIYNGALDEINGASSRKEVLQTEKDVRKRLSDLEQSGNSKANEPKVLRFDAATGRLE